MMHTHGESVGATNEVVYKGEMLQFAVFSF